LDLGWLLATWPEADAIEAGTVSVKPWGGFPTAAELVWRYAGASERGVTALHWYCVLACYKLGIILEGTHARAAAGKAEVSTGNALHNQTLGLFRRAMRWIV